MNLSFIASNVTAPSHHALDSCTVGSTLAGLARRELLGYTSLQGVHQLGTTVVLRGGIVLVGELQVRSFDDVLNAICIDGEIIDNAPEEKTSCMRALNVVPYNFSHPLERNNASKRVSAVCSTLLRR